MKLLIITQKVDKNDPILGFFHRWLEEFSKHCEQIKVICLFEGTHSLPANIEVLSLGKEKGESNLKYIKNFYKYIWNNRANYDKVFIHMNQEYVLLGGLFWKIFGKQILFWRNHPQGNLLTRIAVAFSDRLFCTSKSSFTARFKKTEIMPVGIDTSFFKRETLNTRDWKKILYLGRISRIKNIDIILKAFAQALKKDTAARLVIVGDAPASEVSYVAELKKLVSDLRIDGLVQFKPAVSNSEAVNYYNECGISINATDSGSFDKTICEAMACEQIVITSNKGYGEIIPEEYKKMLFPVEKKTEEFTDCIMNVLDLLEDKKIRLGSELREAAIKNHDLSLLVSKIIF
ncbi:MAG: hypothetical protein QG640_202 [Patescibacteria group bacterium]|nr:hypothetical protein [Patescibacteria group bacterium]